MISLDQVELLEAKIESAVEKITQLQVENDALRNRVQELSNALSAKSEQLSVCEKDQAMIETGILKALNRLNSIENSVLKSGGTTPAAAVIQSAAVVPSPAVETPAAEESIPFTNESEDYAETETPVMEEPEMGIPEESVMEEEIVEDGFVGDEEIDIPVEASEPVPSQEPVPNPFDINKSDVPGFDIF